MKRYILIIDAIGKTKLELSIFLKGYNVEFIHVKDVVSAITKIVELRDSLKLMVIDIDSDIINLDSIKILKEKEICRNIPLVITSIHKEKNFIMNAIKTGAMEYIAKPLNEESVIEKINEIIGLSKENKGVEEEIYEEEEILEYSLKDILSIHLKSMNRGNTPLSIIMMRLINTKETKQVKKRQILDVIIKAVKTKLRETDVIIKYSSENLLVLLPFTDSYGVTLVERKMREFFIENTLVNYKADGFILATSSVSLPNDGSDRDYIIEKLKSKLQPTMFFSKESIY